MSGFLFCNLACKPAVTGPSLSLSVWEEGCSKTLLKIRETAMKLWILQVLVVVAGVGGFVNGATNCNQALDESSACHERYLFRIQILILMSIYAHL